MLGRHLLGIYEKAFDAKDSWESRFQKAKNAGFDYLEISVDETDERLERLYWSRAQRQSLLNASFDAEMPIRSMCLSGHRRFPFGSAEADLRCKAYEIMARAIDLACDLGVRVIQLAGYDVYYENSTAHSVERFLEGMRWAAAEAARRQVMLAMEIMDVPFMNSISKYLKSEETIQSPWYKVYPDLGNLSAWPENDPEEELRKGIDRIVAIHVKDTLAVKDGFSGKFKGVTFGTGCVDFAARFAQLEQLGYTGPYLIEMWYQEGLDDVKQVLHSKQYIEKQFYNAVEAKTCGIT